MTLQDDRTLELNVSEIFGPTWQGEGPSTGRFCAFLRLAGCNLACPWCDSKYARVGQVMTVTSIVSKILEIPTRRLIITGGEPLLQQAGVQAVINAVQKVQFVVEIETNGTIVPQLTGVHQYNVSPKLLNGAKDVDAQVIQAFRRAGCEVFKFVCGTVQDVEEVRNLNIRPEFVWIMPKGVSVAELDASLAAIVPRAMKYGYNLTDRLHIRIWGNRRGH